MCPWLNVKHYAKQIKLSFMCSSGIYNMEVSMFLLVSSVLWKSGTSSIRCFQCLPENSYYDKDKLSCQNFDGSEKYTVECEKSTMCYKRVTTLTLGDEMTSESVRRGCASQSLGKEQLKENGKWVQKTVVHDNAYEEGCVQDVYDLGKQTQTLNCYCRGDRCNHSTDKSVNFKTILLTYLFIPLINWITGPS